MPIRKFSYRKMEKISKNFTVMLKTYVQAILIHGVGNIWKIKNPQPYIQVSIMRIFVIKCSFYKHQIFLFVCLFVT